MNPETNTTPQNPQQPLTQQPTLTQTPISPTPTSTESAKKPSLFKSFLSTTLLIVGALLFALFLNQFVFQSYEVDGSSMEPTLQNGDRLIVWKLPRSWSRVTGNAYQPSRGDIVVFHKPDGSDEQLIKRVIGLPGERVVVKDEKITVYNSEFPNGFNPDDADYGKKLEPTYGNADVIVGKNEIFVSGDNRVPGASLDSRSSLGNVPLENIVGTLAVRIYPF
jgi:signal peptidase I